MIGSRDTDRGHDYRVALFRRDVHGGDQVSLISSRAKKRRGQIVAVLGVSLLLAASLAACGGRKPAASGAIVRAAPQATRTAADVVTDLLNEIAVIEREQIRPRERDLSVLSGLLHSLRDSITKSLRLGQTRKALDAQASAGQIEEQIVGLATELDQLYAETGQLKAELALIHDELVASGSNLPEDVMDRLIEVVEDDIPARAPLIQGGVLVLPTPTATPMPTPRPSPSPLPTAVVLPTPQPPAPAPEEIVPAPVPPPSTGGGFVPPPPPRPTATPVPTSTGTPAGYEPTATPEPLIDPDPFPTADPELTPQPTSGVETPTAESTPDGSPTPEVTPLATPTPVDGSPTPTSSPVATATATAVLTPTPTVIVGTSTPSPTPWPTPQTNYSFGENILLNSDAELNAGAMDTIQVDAPVFWSSPQGEKMTVMNYGAIAKFPPAESSGVDVPGTKFFAGGPIGLAGISHGSQRLNLVDFAYQIDQSAVQYEISAYLGGVDDLVDRAGVTLTFVDDLGRLTGTVNLGPVNPEDRNYQTMFVYDTSTGLVPPGTRRVDVDLVMEGLFGYIDAFADNISLVLTYSPS